MLHFFANSRYDFKGEEDSLASSVFERLLYLPVDMFWRILVTSCYNPTLPKSPGKIINYSFWPHWNPNGTVNSRYVEPDIFIQFEKFHLIIEAKLNDFADTQRLDQWQKEVISYYSHFASEERAPLYFLAIAGLTSGHIVQPKIEIPSHEISLPVNFTRWRRILKEIKLIQHEIAKDDHHKTSGVSGILKDLILAFRLHGFVTGELFNSMPLEIKINKGYVPKFSTV